MAWVTVKSFLTRTEAEIVKGLLIQNGIPAMVRADDAGGMRPNMAYGSGVELQVEEVNITKANIVIFEQEK